MERFNQMLSRIYSFLRGRMGEEVDDFMDEALARIAGQYELLFYGVDLKQYGRADYDQMLANVADLPPDERRRLMVAGLNELVAVDPARGPQRLGRAGDAVVSGIIKDGLPQARGGVGRLEREGETWRRTTTITRSSSPTSSWSSTSWPGPPGSS